MDLSSNNYLASPTLFPSQADSAQESSSIGMFDRSLKNPFLDSFSDSICRLNLEESPNFVKPLPEARGCSEITAQNGVPRRHVEAPLTPGRPIFSFSTTSYPRKTFPSKWDDAEKWLVGGSSCDEGINGGGSVKTLDSSRMCSKQCVGYKALVGEVVAEKSRITEERVSKVISTGFQALALSHLPRHGCSDGAADGDVLSASADVLPKDKFPNEFNLGVHSVPTQEKLVNTPISKHRDVGTEMTPLASSTTSRCPTPFESTSPARHNTPADRSGPLGLMGLDEQSNGPNALTLLQDSHLAKLHCGAQFNSVASNWSSREEEEDDVSKSLRHFEVMVGGGECRKSVSGPKKFVWDEVEEEKSKSCMRYQREESQIQAWVNLQSAKAEAESRKLEVKIQKMRATLEEKLMKRMAGVHRRAEEWRADAWFHHSEQIRKAGGRARRHGTNKRTDNNSCGCLCFPCKK